MEEGVDTVGDAVLWLFRGQNVLGNLGWRKEGVDTVSNGVLLLFGGQNVLGNLVWRRVLTQSVTGCCCCLEDKTF